ncbi:MAG: TolC family protein [Arenicellales bacterium]
MKILSFTCKPSTIRSLIVGVLIYGYASLGLCQSVGAEFPKVLTLPQALEMLDDNHPGLLLTRARMQEIGAERVQVDADTALKAIIGLELRGAVKASDPDNDFVDDSRALFVLDKPLTTFGREQVRTGAVRTELDSLGQKEVLNRASIRLDAMRAFFEVIIADYAYTAIDEEMTLAFLHFDDAREQMERYHELPEVEVRALEVVYLDAFAKRTAARHEQRASRLRLALALNRPMAYPDQLIEPDLSKYSRQLPDYEELLESAMLNNHSIKSAKLQLEAQRQRLDGLSLARRPTLGARFQAAEYERILGSSRDQFRASLYLDIPLTVPRLTQGEIARQSAAVLKYESNVKLIENELRLNVLRLVQRLEQLDSELNAARTDLLYRELDLDRVRLQYEMEVRARIGGANTEVARSLHRLAYIRYQRALVWEQLDMLAGRTEVFFE